MSSYSMTIVVVVQFGFTLMWAVRCVVRIVRFPSRIRNTYDSPSTRIHCRWLPSCRIRFDITITAAAIATHHNTILCCTVTNTERRRCVHVDGPFVYSYRLQYASHRIASTREWNWIGCVNMVYGIRCAKPVTLSRYYQSRHSYCIPVRIVSLVSYIPASL